MTVNDVIAIVVFAIIGFGVFLSVTYVFLK
jgi:hypothetical protein